MNIFYLDKDPETCAKYHVDSHVIKQILESAQLLSTAHRVLDKNCLSEEKHQALYQVTHQDHPSCVWVMRSKGNYEYLYALFIELLKEYTYRYNKTHDCVKLMDALKDAPYNINDYGFTEFTQVVPEECRQTDPVDAYRDYYVKHKKHLWSYKARSYPWWLLDAL